MRSPRQLLRDYVAIPDFEAPPGRWLDLRSGARIWLTDIAATQGAPTIVLLHAVGCTGLLTWFPVLEELSKRYRVVLFDQRWHGRGLVSDEFSLTDCADDVAGLVSELGLVDPIIAGYSMGSVIAQRTWRQHPEVVGGLVLAATTDHFRTNGQERIFHQGMESSMALLRALSRSRAVNTAARVTADAMGVGYSDTHDWALREFRSTSPWAVGQALAALGRHHSTPWLGKIDVPTAVVITCKDRVIPAARQRAVAERIPGATVHEAACGHAGCVLESEAFVPTLLEAVHATAARVHDRQLLREERKA